VWQSLWGKIQQGDVGAGRSILVGPLFRIERLGALVRVAPMAVFGETSSKDSSDLHVRLRGRVSGDTNPAGGHFLAETISFCNFAGTA